MSNESNGRTRWLVIGLPVLAAIFTAIGFVYVVGQRTSKIIEVVEWKKETAPRIERMDSKGTLSFEIFHAQYNKEQGQQYVRIGALEQRMSELWTSERLKELEKDTKEVDVLKARIEALERERKQN